MRKKKTEEDLINEELEDLRYAWRYRGEVFDFSPERLKGYAGFVYEIKNLVTGRRYIGQKLFTKAKTTQRDGKKVKSRVESTWKRYYGSNKELVEDVRVYGRENFERRILYLCESKTNMNYLETLEILRQGALLTETFYNQWVSIKVSKKYLKNISENPKFPLT